MAVLLTIENLRSIHAGRPAIIAGAGPSLRHLAPEDTGKFVMICLNSTILKYPDAQYYFSTDPGVTLQKSWQYLKSIACTVALAQPNDGNEHFRAYDSRRQVSYRGEIPDERLALLPRKPDGNNLRFEPSDTELIFGWSSAHCATHLAFLMGCSPIILVGCDCGPVAGRHYFSDFEGQGQWADGLDDEKMAEYFSKPHHPSLPAFGEYWNRLAEHNPTVEIINCGNAIMPNIQPEKLKDVLQKYGQ